MNIRPLRLHPEFRPTHEMKCWPEKFEAIKRGLARATCRRVDDRNVEIGDRIVFVLAVATGQVLEPREEFDAVVTRIERMAGPHQLFGADGAAAGELLPFALIHFIPAQLELPVAGDDLDEANDYRKILSFAASAGDTIEIADALSVIKSICRQHLFSVRGSS